MIRFLFPVFTALSVSSVQAHELFLQPETYELETGAPLRAEIRVGEAFEGSRSIFNDKRFERFDVAVGDKIAPVEGRLGDLPAANVPTENDGLHILVHQSGNSILRYKTFEKFESFARHKDLLHLVEAHKAQNLPMADFIEVYSRYAKSLVAVGGGEGKDRAFGLETEIVALANPYTDALNNGMRVRVLYQGAPRADAQIELFERMGDAVEITLHRTDSDGIATFAVKSGAEYMVDAVVGRAPSPALAKEKNAIWETLWANLTFRVPE